ncbi:electron transfer flavoprotein subunit alpha/FixB family protein, partial [Halobacteria archaeon AArc-curdl1]|nr:electron transfer flavoprotein subunit alpha/FixB family protein [Halobacteria archaeon AArc-curdl1]
MSDILAIAEHRQSELRDVSLELITAGVELADQTGGDLHVAVISGDVEGYADELNRVGVDAIHTVAYGEEFNHDVYTQAVTQLVDSIGPSYMLGPNSVNGLDYLPAVATRLDVPLVTDVVGLETAGETLTATREMYGGKVETTVDVEGTPVVVSIRGAEWPVAEGAGSADVEAFDAEIDEDAIGSSVNGFEEVAGGDVDISEADLLVSVGRG